MEHSSIADMAGWRSLLIQLGLVAIGFLSIVILFSFGGQLVAAPGLLPAQWLIARHSDGWISTGFAVLGGLLSFEVLTLGVPLLLGDSAAVGLAAVVLGLAGGTLFYLTGRTRR